MRSQGNDETLWRREDALREQLRSKTGRPMRASPSTSAISAGSRRERRLLHFTEYEGILFGVDDNGVAHLVIALQ
jgi:hypothetical protein